MEASQRSIKSVAGALLLCGLLVGLFLWWHGTTRQADGPATTGISDAPLSDWKPASRFNRARRPIPAAVLFNAVIIFSHWPSVVNTSVSNGVVHYGMHVLLVGAAVLAWLPVCGPIPEWRMSLPAQMIYLFAMSIVPPASS